MARVGQHPVLLNEARDIYSFEENFDMRSRTLAIALAAATLPVLAGDMRFAGTWKLNPEKSHFSHGELPKSLIITIEANGPDGIRYQSKNLVGEKTGGISYTAKFDGTDSPVTGTTSYDIACVRKVDSRTLQIQMKKDGNIVVTIIFAVAADGKSLTRKGMAKKGPGEANTFDEWFDRQ